VPPHRAKEKDVPALALWTPEDGLLGALAPLGAALAVPSALVIDLDPHGPPYPGERSLADLVADDPTEDELVPRPGVAVLRNGGVRPAQAAEIVSALIERWPRVVLRLAPWSVPDGDVPVVPVRLLTGGWFQGPARPGVWQATADWVPMPADGVRLPVPEVSTVRALLAGRMPGRSRWISAWGSVWGARWVG
jgi:hypothetical protein